MVLLKLVDFPLGIIFAIREEIKYSANNNW